jgi:predicted  nucleic acid-binding Zn-ribbon protein
MRIFSNQACEELRNQEIEIMDLQKQIMEWEAKIKQQQNLYETARTERTVNSRKVLESQNEIDEMKRKFKLMNQLVEQLKEEINSKDIALIKEHYDHQKVYTSKAFLGVFCLLSSHNIVLLPSS